MVAVTAVCFGFRRFKSATNANTGRPNMMATGGPKIAPKNGAAMADVTSPLTIISPIRNKVPDTAPRHRASINHLKKVLVLGFFLMIRV